MYNIITKKKRGEKLTREEIEYVVKGFTEGSIPDYQMSALLMAIVLNKMDEEETYELTMAMERSGDVLDLSRINNITADKHSTGGVGDKTSLIVGPVTASLGISLAKMSGRGLGHTGGTIDKLESIPGFSTYLSEEDFIGTVNTVGMAIIAQSGELAPADKKIYALRDVTATVDDISLIASSIMSKKLAAGAKVIVLDVKCGSGAFMKTLSDAVKLAEEMIKIGTSAGRKVCALISDMNQPLGEYVGNRLEVYEAVKVLKGGGNERLVNDCVTLSALMLKEAGKAGSFEEGKEMALAALNDGSALEVFKRFVTAQKGDTAFIDNEEEFISGTEIKSFKAESEGYVGGYDTELIGMASLYLGGGRATKDDVIDPHVGLKVYKALGDRVEKGDVLFDLYYNDESKLARAEETLRAAVRISAEKPELTPAFYGYVDTDGFHEIGE